MQGKGARTYLEEAVREMVSVRAGNHSINLAAPQRSSQLKMVTMVKNDFYPPIYSKKFVIGYGFL